MIFAITTNSATIAIFILTLIICAQAIIVAWQRDTLHKLYKDLAAMKEYTQAMAWTDEDEKDVRVVDDPRPDGVEDWLIEHPGTSPMAERNER